MKLATILNEYDWAKEESPQSWPFINIVKYVSSGKYELMQN